MFALEGEAMMPNPEMTAAGVEKRWDWGQREDVRRSIPRKGRRCPDHREIATKSGGFDLIY
jgi:hypothetical protein